MPQPKANQQFWNNPEFLDLLRKQREIFRRPKKKDQFQEDDKTKENEGSPRPLLRHKFTQSP